jgi:hypothetical protein
MDEENTDTQVSVKTQCLLCETTHTSLHTPFLSVYELLNLVF